MVPLHGYQNSLAYASGSEIYRLPHARANTIPHRTSMRTTNVRSATISARSAETMNRYRPRQALMTLHGTTARQNTASNVPTEFARNAFAGSACMVSAKLVVNPHEGHG